MQTQPSHGASSTNFKFCIDIMNTLEMFGLKHNHKTKVTQLRVRDVSNRHHSSSLLLIVYLFLLDCALHVCWLEAGLVTPVVMATDVPHLHSSAQEAGI